VPRQLGIYHITSTTATATGEFHGFVVLAESESEARKMAHKKARDGWNWKSKKDAACYKLGKTPSHLKIEPQIVSSEVT